MGLIAEHTLFLSHIETALTWGASAEGKMITEVHRRVDRPKISEQEGMENAGYIYGSIAASTSNIRSSGSSLLGHRIPSTCARFQRVGTQSLE